jgi:hypothetical protein
LRPSLPPGSLHSLPRHPPTLSPCPRILKPVGLSRGRGIRLVSSLEDVQDALPEEPVVVQRYLTAPLLVQVGGEVCVRHSEDRRVVIITVQG